MAAEDIDTTTMQPFRLLQELGRGGFARAYRAQVLDPELRLEFGAEEVALKIPLDRQKERVLRRELELNAGLHLRLKGLQSENLVRYLGFEVFRGQIVMVMEFVQQGSLRGLLGRIGHQTALPVDEAVTIAEGVLKGLSIIHGERVLHRDIKPENILLQGRIAKIADFGIARLLESDQVAATQAGTIPYMSPEILTQHGASFTSDLWSLAVTLYEMVTGKLPFGDENTPIGPFVGLICNSEPRPASEVASGVRPELSTIITRALRKNPADRYGSAAEMGAALAEYRTGGGPQLEAQLAEIRDRISTMGQAAQVEQQLRQLVAKYPNHVRVHQLLGEFHSRCQRYREAIAAFEQALALEPRNALLHWNLALAFQGAGQKAQAVRSLDMAMTLGLDPSLRRHASTLKNVLKGGA